LDQRDGAFVTVTGDRRGARRDNAHMTASQIESAADLLAARERWVARGVSAPAIVAVRAEGSHIEGADGVRYLDFAGGIGCQNLGHGPAGVVSAIHAQVDTFLHQCFMVAAYEPYVDVCRRLGELSPCRGTDQRSVLFNSGAEAVENAVKVARASTGRPAVVAFDRGFHGRTLLTMSLTSKVKPYKKGFGPFAPEIYRAPAPYPYRGIGTEESIRALEELFVAHVDPASVAAVILEPVQGEGGFLPMPADFPKRLRELLDRHGILWIDDEVQAGVGRTGPVWAIEHYDAQPDILVSGKSLGGGLPLAAVTGPASVMDAVDPGGLGGTFGGNPVACAAAAVVLDTVATPEFHDRALALGEKIAAGLEGIASRVETVGETRGLGPMRALELVRSRESREPAPERVSAAIAAARRQGLLLLGCGMYANVIRLLPPLTISDADLAHGLEVLEAALA
jgi:4-aminobutyrate aminotransferase/(S)-3-amino-2-methylpropionate transaminase